MTEPKGRERWRPTRTKLVASGIVIGGFWLTSLNWWFLLLVGIGTFGPGVLREIGWLHDKDEFQRHADQRAGYHAFLTSGLTAFVLVPFFRSGERSINDTQELATFFLVLLWFTWLLSALVAYWGAHKAAARFLYVFGSAVLVFTIISNIGPEWTGWAALLMHPLLAAPFFALAWLSGRWPRVTGILLLAAFIFFLQFFRFNLERVTDGVTFILFLGPLLAGGIALLLAGKKTEDPDDADELLITGN